MNKIGKRFVALAVVFASIMSFLPIQLGSNGKAANAITTQIQVSGTPVASGGNGINIVNGEYTTDDRYNDFSLVVDYKIVDDESNIPIGQTGVVAQEVIITNIDGIELNGATLQENNDKLKDMGISIGQGTDIITDKNNNKKIGRKITGLPFGVNIIKYRIKETTKFNKGKHDDTKTDPNAIINDLQPQIDNYFPSQTGSEEIVIQHANKFVQNKIQSMKFDSYLVKTMQDYNASTTPKDNKFPFLFSEDGVADSNSPLRYNFAISDAVMTLRYSMTSNSLSGSNAKIFKNGKDDTANIITNGNTISGYLTNLAASDLIVARMLDTSDNVVKSYAIQLKYNTIEANKDYSLREAGIKKLYFDADSSVEAYVDKQFQTSKENGVTTYRGKITIDKKAQMIGMLPILGAKTNIAYKLSNHYDNGLVENARIVGGQSATYVNFQAGSNSNQLWLEVYEGQDGNIKQGTTPLAIYKLDVNLIGSDSTVNLSVDDDVDHGNQNKSYLTQPGRIKIDDKIDFNASRRTYNLNFSETDTTKINDVIITLNTPNTQDDKTHERREYLKVWAGTSSQNDNVIEITDIIKGPEVSVNIVNYKKIIVQAYYDQTIYEKDENGKDKPPKITPYPLGEKYTFYIAKNPDTDGNNGNTKSSDASLSNISATNGTIKSTDGTSGFSSGKINYELTVPKIDTSSAITVTASNNKVKDITATIAETRDEYGLTSGTAFDFPLNSTGKTNVKIVITAEDGVTTKTYNVTISNDIRSTSALLKDVVTDNGNFTFDSDNNPNKIRVDQKINKLKVSPIAGDAKARVTVNGIQYAGSPITIDLKGSQKIDMEIKVTSEDGSNSKTYYFEIYRTDAPIDSNNDNSNEGDLFYDDIDDCWVDLSKYEEWGTVGGKTVYFNNKGRQVKNQWVNTKGVWYFLDSKGYKASGWRKETGGKTYYLDSNTGAIRTGWMNQNNKWYYLGLNGVMQKGWLNLNGHWYYFTPEGEMIVSQSMFIDDGVYRFGADGAMY